MCMTLAGCQQQGQNISNADRQYIEIGQRYTDALSKQDTDAMAELFSEDYHEIGPYKDSVYTKKEALQRWSNAFAGTDTIIYDRIYTLHEEISEGDLKGNWVMEWGSVKEKLHAFPDTVHMDIHAAILVEDNKIKSVHHFYNAAEFHTQLGFNIQPPGSN